MDELTRTEDSDKKLKRWTLGVLFPLYAFVQGIRGLITQSCTFGKGSGYTVHGPGAIAASVVGIAFGLCFHVFFFWADRYGFEGWHGLLCAISLLLLVASAGYCAYLLMQ